MRFLTALWEGFGFALGFFVMFPVFTKVVRALAGALL